MNPTPRSPIQLSQWIIIVSPSSNPYLAPELTQPLLNGYAHGHPRFANGHNVTTSRILGKNTSGHILTKSGSIYQLGEPKEDYAEKFPNARQRLLDSLPLITDPALN